MRIDTSLGYNYWINTLASIHDNPDDSLDSFKDVAEAVSVVFGEDYDTVLGHVIMELSDTPKVENNWEILQIDDTYKG